ncbi:MAG: hypothetical protein IJA53_09735 [Spirochaetaceae bacterium]|nr:hypothetical protein [Spirochaetaceae bacterium]MBQ4555374.1 hypothetical protein [Spirochaetaceae bacterium]
MSISKPLIILFKFFCVLVGFVLALVLLVLLGLNLFKFGYYNEYFSLLSKEAKNPGLSENFVPQGITHCDNLFVTVGYMADDTNSRIYTVDYITGEVKHFPLISDGRSFVGHTGGIQYSNGYFYLANEGNSLYKFTAASVYQKNGTKIEIGLPIKLNSNTSFVYGKENFLYVGEFHKNPEYPCTNEISYNGQTHYAIVEKYDISDLSKPLAVYSIPELVQGFCVKSDGTIVLSTSWSVNSSKFYIYEPEKIVKTGTSYNGADLYFLTEPSKTVKAPAMSEDLDIISIQNHEKVITMFESACNKYVFGKFFFANYIASLGL